jgi:phospholipid/cholesterol/gamma-HCH transport system substrate-binding protein
MKAFSERNHVIMGAVGLGLTLVVSLLALNYNELPFVDTGKEYSAYFAEAGGLKSDAVVQVSGLDVGKVSSLALDGSRVLIKFKINSMVRLGERTEAAVKLAGVLGTKLLEITPRGEGELTGPIPQDRTTPAYQLADALGDLTTTIGGLDTDQLSNALAVVANEFSDTPPAVQAAVQGVARLSQTLDERDRELRNLLTNVHKATTVLAERSNEVLNLVTNTNSLLAQLKTQQTALGQITNNISALAQQLKGFIAENRETLKPALDKLNGVLTILDNRKERIQKVIKQLNSFAAGLGESVSAEPGFKANVANLPPGQFIQPFIDAAFSDLGLDPATLLPSQLADPLTGQPATPPLPVPFPRTGQGGPPRLNVPDAITGNPGDRPCGLPGMLLAGQGCYPLREEPPAPPPGGPPPGPPASPPSGESVPQTAPSAVYLPAPGEPPRPSALPTTEAGR